MSYRYSSIIVLLSLWTVVSSEAQTATAPSAGDGTSGDPYQIATLDNLYWITQNNTEWGKYFIQTANIDASSTSGWDSGSGFSPIGSNSTSFTGSYDGDGYSISGLTIARSSTSYIALFGFISNATISNVHLINASISGDTPVGALVGFSTGSGSAVIEYCSATGSVTGTQSQLGGLIGKTQAGTTVRYCYADVNVSTTNGNYVGGFVGHNDQSSTISNCYSRGNVSGYNQVGGFAGVNQSATISNCYSTGSATGNSSVGGFVGAVASSTINNSFWDTEASGNATSSGGTGKTTAEMKTASTFTDAGWDFTTVWEIVSSFYPRLQSIPDGALPVQMVGLRAEVISGSSAPRQSSGQEVRLSWTTASESDNLGWEVERRRIKTQVGSSETEAPGWVKIGFVEGAGTSTSAREYVFTDRFRFPNDGSLFTIHPFRYAYRLRQIDRSGASSYSHELEVDLGASLSPFTFQLSPPYPNPFNPTTTIEFTVPEDGRASLKILNMLGQQVAEVFNGPVTAGRIQSVTFDATGLASGLYFSLLEHGSDKLLQRMILAK